MRWLAAALLTALLLLQYRLWFSSDGVRDVLRLNAEVVAQQQQNATLTERNRQLAGEVRDLKQGYAALEEHARADLGMIAGNETFYQVVPPADSAGPLSAPLEPGGSEAPEPATPAAPAGAAPAATALLGDATTAGRH
jgi:cell division protein FtsB